MDANDYLGEGVNSGSIAIPPPEDDAGDPVSGANTVLYDATGGELFVAGKAGERSPFGMQEPSPWWKG